VFQLCHSDLDGEFPPLRSLGASNLPIQVTSFVGRVGESVELEKLIRGSRLVTVTGAGGCGKSRLALQVAAGMSGEFPDGVWLVELAPLADADLLAATVAAAVGVQQQPGRRMVESLIGFLRTRSLLLVVDNCEHLIGAAAELVSEVLSQTPQVRVVATSREPLHVQGETVFHLDPLPVNGTTGEMDVLLRSDGVRLFAERAEAANPRFRLTRGNAAVVAGICSRLDGIPLGLELSASASRLLTLDQIERRLGDRFRLHTGETRDNLDHHRTLEATIDWSYRLLDADQQALFERLAVFAAPFSLEAAEAVCPDGDILERIVELADRSLLEIDETPLGVRYRMLETIPKDLQDRLREGHCRFFLSLAEQAVEGPISADDPPEWLPQLDAATPDLRQALAWAIETNHDQHAADLIGALGWYWHVRSRHAEAIRWIRSTPLRSATIKNRSRIRALYWAAHHLTNAMTAAATSDIPLAEELAEEALGLARRTGDPGLIAACLAQTGGIGVIEGDLHAVDTLVEAMEAAREAGDLWRQVRVRNMLAHHYDEIGRHQSDAGSTEQAKALWEENLRIQARIGDDRGMAMTLCFRSLQSVEACDRDLEEARRLAESSLEIGRRLGDFGVLNNALNYLTGVVLLQGDYETARELQREVAELTWRTLGEEDDTVYLYYGEIDYAQGNFGSARRNLGRGLRLMDPSAGFMALRFLRYALCTLGQVLAREGNLQEAAVLFASLEADGVLPTWIAKQEQGDLRECVELIEKGLPADDLQEAQQQGAAMTLAQAVDYALALLDRDGAEPNTAAEPTGED
jgi:predicted ATPase